MAPSGVDVLVQVLGSGTLTHAVTRAVRVVLGSWNLSSPQLSGNVTLKAWNSPAFLLNLLLLAPLLPASPS